MSKSHWNEELEKIGKRLNYMEIRQQITDYNETVPINRLPVELFCMILKCLDLGDLFLYESVCKKWRYYVSGAVNQRLVIAKSGKLKGRHWFFLDELCPPASVMVKETLNFKILKSSFLFSLKRLKICDPTIKNDYQKCRALLENAQLINQLVNLEVLELSQLGKADGEEQFTIKLANLKHLAVHHHFYFNLLLDCPQLVSFKTKTRDDDRYFYRDRTDFLHPLSITHLYLDEYSNQYSLENLEKLKKLEHLSVASFHLTEYDEEEELAKDYAKRIFANFPNLKEISLRPDSPSYFMGRETFVHLLKERNVLGRERVALTFYGIRIDAEVQLEYQADARYQPYDKFIHLLSSLYMKNHSKLCEQELKRVRELDYSGLLDYSGKDKAEILTDLIRKFDRVEKIQVSDRVNDEQQLIDFLKRLKRFDTLKIGEKAQLGSGFYDKLSATCSNPWLAIQMKPQNNRTNFDFVFKLKNLVAFKVCKYDASDEFVQRLFDHFDSIQFEHQVQDDQVKITKKSETRFEFSVCPEHLEIFDNLSKLLQKVNKCCRGYHGEHHRHDCECEILYCPSHSYTENIRKQYY